MIEAGLEGRTSLDLDVGLPGSDADRSALAAACADAGLDFDPTGETHRPYLQLIHPGIVTVPVKAGRWGGLTILTPPPAALAAMKLVRADIFFLCSRHGLTRAGVAAYVRQIPDSVQRQTAQENLVYLEVP